MSFIDYGIVLNARPHGETQAVVHIFTKDHGLRAGLVYGGQGRRMRPLLQPGNELQVEWKGRGENSLGHFNLEMTRARAGEMMQDRLSLAGMSAACAVALGCLPEHEAHGRAYDAMTVLLNNLDDIDIWPALMARWELGLLSELGFGLTLDRCASTGARENLIYVSPNSACAVSQDAGEPYKDKLLPLPRFLRDGSGEATLEEALQGLQTTGYFIETRILHLSDKPLPEARRRMISMLQDRLNSES